MKRRTRRASEARYEQQTGAPFITLPEDWSAEQALAVFEIVDELLELLWHGYGAQIQQALRAQQSITKSTAQLDIDDGDDPAF